MRLGDWIEKIISILTFGKGHAMAMWVAHLFGYEDCGCEGRKNWLNNLFTDLDNEPEFIYIDDRDDETSK